MKAILPDGKTFIAGDVGELLTLIKAAGYSNVVIISKEASSSIPIFKATAVIVE
jgi:hypothetical protein